MSDFCYCQDKYFIISLSSSAYFSLIGLCLTFSKHIHYSNGTLVGPQGILTLCNVETRLNGAMICGSSTEIL